MTCSQLRRQDWPMVGILAIPLGLEFQACPGRPTRFRPVDGLEVDGHFLTVFPGHKAQAVTHQMYDAGLDLAFLIASRKVLSWRLSNTLEADFCVAALREA